MEKGRADFVYFFLNRQRKAFCANAQPTYRRGSKFYAHFKTPSRYFPRLCLSDTKITPGESTLRQRPNYLTTCRKIKQNMFFFRISIKSLATSSSDAIKTIFNENLLCCLKMYFSKKSKKV